MDYTKTIAHENIEHVDVVQQTLDGSSKEDQKPTPVNLLKVDTR